MSRLLPTVSQEIRHEKENDFRISKKVHEELTKQAFDEFDPAGKGNIPIQDLANVVRCLGLNPSQKQLEEISLEVTGNVTVQTAEGTIVNYEKFKAYMVPVLMENKLQRDDESTLKKAFRTIDVEKRGYIEPEKLAGLLSSYGEVFTQEEIEDMFHVAVDRTKGVIFYEQYAARLAND